jgi:hypothetical protein
MCGSVWGRREFELKPRRLNRTPTQRKTVMHEPNRCLTFKVTDPMPRLEVDCVNFPGIFYSIIILLVLFFSFCITYKYALFTDVLYRGELRQAGLCLRNCSSRMGLKNVRVRCSHPNAVLFGERSGPMRLNGESVSLDVELAPGAELIVPIWIHFATASPSNQSMRFLFYYESEVVLLTIFAPLVLLSYHVSYFLSSSCFTSTHLSSHFMVPSFVKNIYGKECHYM